MPKVNLKHQTADGVVHTRKTARTYSHVIVSTEYWDGKALTAGNAPVPVSWVGRPDLVASALAQHQKRDSAAGLTWAEPINGGVRP